MTSVPVVARVARGAFAGAAATAAMGLVMLGARRAGFVGELAPEEITEAGLDAAGAERSEQSENALATAAHFAYGAGNGALYSLVAPRLPGPPLMRGLTFAAGLLFVSYEGWVPAARILPPLHAQTSGGRWTLVAGHLVYGATLARLAP